MGYLDAQAGDGARSAFRKAEKQYKLYKSFATSRSGRRSDEVPATDLSAVLDFREIMKERENAAARECGIEKLEGSFDFPVYVLRSHPGFYFIPDAVPVDQQFQLIRDALTTYTEPPNRTSHTAHYGPLSGLWSAACKRLKAVEVEPTDVSEEMLRCLSDIQIGDQNSAVKQPRVLKSDGGRQELFIRRWKFVDETEWGDRKAIPAQALLRKLRWATLGVQFDWSQRAYDISLPHRGFPKPLSELAAKLAEPAMCGMPFHAEAAIVNFFGTDDMLGGHIDDMEADWNKPIVSISLGCRAIFLLGGASRDDVPVAMLLRSGDAVLMKGPARGCFHGVPRIFVNEDSEVPSYEHLRVNSVDDSILDYIKVSRININIREVF